MLLAHQLTYIAFAVIMAASHTWKGSMRTFQINVTMTDGEYERACNQWAGKDISTYLDHIMSIALMQDGVYQVPDMIFDGEPESYEDISHGR